MWSVNKISDKVRPTIWEFFITATANSLSGLAVRLLLQDELFSYYWQPYRFIYMVTTNRHAVFHGAQGLVDLIHGRLQLSLEFITWKLWLRTSNNKCQSHISRQFCWVAGVKSCWKEINTQAIIWGNTVYNYVR